MASVAPLLPTPNIISAPVAPTPEVDLRVRVEVVPVPPYTIGELREVATATVPVKLADEDIVWELINPDVTVPILVRLPELSILAVPPVKSEPSDKSRFAT